LFIELLDLVISSINLTIFPVGRNTFSPTRAFSRETFRRLFHTALLPQQLMMIPAFPEHALSAYRAFLLPAGMSLYVRLALVAFHADAKTLAFIFPHVLVSFH
jgi:hypothetical protein